MRFCTSLLLSALLAVTAGCGLVGGQTRFVVSEVDVKVRDERVDTTVTQRLQLSRAARRAVNNGVPLILNLRMEIMEEGNAIPVAAHLETFEIRYLPMSERYELLSPERGERQTYPRLRHVLRRLSQVRVRFDDVALREGVHEVRARVNLDRSSLPAPMQLPSVVYTTWRHDSDWTQWPFRISA